MTEIIGDVVMPSELVVPQQALSNQAIESISGQMFISGAFLMYVDYTGTMKTLTGA